jgi:hypothetical protein
LGTTPFLIGQIMRLQRWTLGCMAGSIAVFLAGPAAATVAFVASDRVYSPSVATATNSLAKESAWLAAAGSAGPIHAIDFETFNTTTTPLLLFPLTPGVTMMTPSGALGPPQGFTVDNSTPVQSQGNYSTQGFNTTPGGQNHAVFHCSSPPSQLVSFTFTQPIQAFSMWITGTGSGGFVFDRGIHQIEWDGSGPGGFFFNVFGPPFDAHWDNVIFVGFADPTASTTRVDLWLRFPSFPNSSGGAYSFDDIRWVAADVPEPTSFAWLCAATGVGAIGRRSFKSRASGISRLLP